MRIDFDTILGLLFFVVFVVLPLVSRARKGSGTPGQPGQPGQPPRPGMPGAPGPGTQGRQAQGGGQTAQRQLMGQPTAQAAPPPARPGSPMATLEEIRRRVMEAQEREEQARRLRESGQGAMRAGQPQASTAQAPTARPAGGSLVSAPPSSIGGSQPRPTIAGNQPGHPQHGSRPLAQDAQGAQRARELLLESFTHAPSQGGLGREGPPPGTVRPTVKPRTRSTVAAVASAEAAAYKQRQPGPLRSRLGSPALVELSRDGILKGLLWHEVLSEPVARRMRRTRSRPR